MNLNNIFTIIFCVFINITIFSQEASWPLDNNWNQINCTFAEKHSEFHGGIDINVVDGTEFKAILDGIVEEDANSSNFFASRHDFKIANNINSHLKKVRYGDDTDPLSGIIGLNSDPINYSVVSNQQNIGELISGGHLHFEMWIRDCISPNCAWYRVDPLNNTHANYINQPPGYNDVYDVEINDVILEPQNNHSGLMFNNGNGLQNWHFNSCKIHKKDRPDSHGPTHSYYGSSITAYGDILPTIHVRDTEVTNGINSTGEGLGIFEAVYWIDDNMKYWLRFDEIENEYVDEWESFFNSKYNNVTGQSILYGNHDYLKMHRLISVQYCSPHNSIQSGIWKTRLKIGYINEITDIPQNAQYNDDEYDVDFSILDAAGNRDDANNLIKVDNFWPYIKEIKIYDVTSIPKLLTVLKRNSFEGTTAENDGYIKNSWLIPAEFVFTGGFSNIKIEVITSEPMQSMRVKNAISSIFYQWQNMVPVGNDNKKWEFTFNSYFLTSIGCPYDFEFDGKDKNNNKLLDVYHLSDENGAVPVDIPARIASNGNILDWINFPTSTLYDRVKLCVNNCEPGGLVPRSETGSACDALKNLEVITEDIPCGGKGSIKLSNLNLNLYNYSIYWFDENDQIFDEFNGLADISVSEPGVYCYKIENEDGCCMVSDCYEIKELIFSYEDVIYSFEDIVNEPGKKNLKITVMNVPEIYDYNFTLTLTDENGNVITKTISENDINSTEFENLIVGKEYCLHIENEDGFCYDHCYIVEGNPCSLLIDAEVTHASCPEFNDGEIKINISNSQSGCESYSYIWNNGAISPDLNNLSPGLYCLTITPTEKACSDCIAVKCFTIEGAAGVPVEVNAVTRIHCVEEYNETTGNYTIKWFGFVDMIVSGGTGNYTFKWYPQPINSGSNQNGGVNSYRFQFDQPGPYCVEITDDCGNIYQNCFDDAPIVRKSTDGISLEAAEKFACLSVDGPRAEGFYHTFGFTDPKFNIVDLMSQLANTHYPAIMNYNPYQVFIKEYSSVDSVSYNMLVDNRFIMGNIGLKLSTGLRERSVVVNNETKVMSVDKGLILQAFPNPFSDLLNISVCSKENIHGVLEVYDIMGQKIYTENITVEKDNNINRSLPSNSIRSGIYTISLLTDESYKNIKVVKVK